MRRRKLKLIEDYIFAKSLNLLAKNTIVSRENIENFNLVTKALIISDNLLIQAKNEIIKNKLNNLSFLILEKELNAINYNKSEDLKLKKIKEMLSKL